MGLFFITCFQAIGSGGIECKNERSVGMDRETLYSVVIAILFLISLVGWWVLRWHKRKLQDQARPPRGGRDLLTDLKYPAVFRTKRFRCPDCCSEVHINDDRCPVCATEFQGDELRCPHCFSKASLSQVNCAECGELLETDPFACPKCGAVVAPTARVCSDCGAEFWSPVRRSS